MKRMLRVYFIMGDTLYVYVCVCEKEGKTKILHVLIGADVYVNNSMLFSKLSFVKHTSFRFHRVPTVIEWPPI